MKLVGGVEIAEDVKDKVQRVGVRGMDIEKAKELGFFTRISNLLCASHASVMAAYRIYGNAASLISELGTRKTEIAKAMNDYEKAFMRFVSFWTDYYASGQAGVEVNEEMENLYHCIMDWSQLPEQWSLGDAQRKEEDADIAIKVKEENGKVLFFHKTVLETSIEDDISESWCVTKFNERICKQETVNTDMDKASAMMIAKRLSSEDPDNIYTASVIQEMTEKKVIAVPFKTYKNNHTIGSLTKIIK